MFCSLRSLKFSLKSSRVIWPRPETSAMIRRWSSAAHPPASKLQEDTDEMMRSFLDMKPQVIQDLQSVLEHKVSDDVVSWMTRLIDYNIFKDRRLLFLARLMTLARNFLILPEEQTPECKLEFLQLVIVVELLWNSVIISDDIMDATAVRRGKTSWHMLPDVGSSAVNDTLLMSNGAFLLIWKYFRHKPYFMPLLHTSQKILYRTFIGQVADLQAGRSAMKNDLSMFTMDHYLYIVSNKTDHVTYYMLATALYVAGITCPELHRQLEQACEGFLSYKQIENDYKDVFGAQNDTTGHGTDIQNGKCAWPIVEALRRATPLQKRVLEECYGSYDPVKVQAVRTIFEELDVRAACIQYILDSKEAIEKRMNDLPTNLPLDLFRQAAPLFHNAQKLTIL